MISKRMPGREELRPMLRAEHAPDGAVVLIRGGPDTVEKLRKHAQKTALAWSLDGQPLLGISVFAVLDVPADELLRSRLANYRVVHQPTVARLYRAQFQLLPTFRRPHFTVRLQRADDSELNQLLAALGPPWANSEYCKDAKRL